MVAPADVDYLVPKHDGVWTVEDVLALPEDGTHRIELVDGTLLVSPAPSYRHQRVLHRMLVELDTAVPSGMELLPGVNIRVNDRQLLIPDFVVTTAPGLDALYGEVHDVLLACEIESPSSRIHDRVLKRHLYAEAGVPYYLLVDCADRPAAATLHELRHGEYSPIAESKRGRLELERPFAAKVSLGD